MNTEDLELMIHVNIRVIFGPSHEGGLYGNACHSVVCTLSVVCCGHNLILGMSSILTLL